MSRFVEPDIVLRWIPGVSFGVLLLVVLRRHNHFLILPGMVIAGILLFDLFLWLTNTSIAQAMARGWLLILKPA